MKHVQPSAPIETAHYFLPTIVGQTLTEFEIIHLQDAFLCKGIHPIITSNIHIGRTCMYLFIESLRLSNVACLTMNKIPLSDNIFAIYDMLSMFAVDEIINELCIEQFFIELADYDFIWIEICDELEVQLWYKSFKRHLDAYISRHHLSVIFLQVIE